MKNGETAKKSAEQKKVIFYARDYRHFTATAKNTVLFLALCVLPIVIAFIFLYSPITKAMCLWVDKIVSAITGQTIELMSTPFLPGMGGVFYISLQGSLPTFTHAVIAGIIALVAIIIVSQAGPNSRPLMIYICMALYVLLASCLFFIFWPESFPYTLTDYSQLYMVQFAAMLIILPAIFGVALSLMRSSTFARVAVVFVQIAVQFLYNLLRYVTYIVFLYYCSSLYMATMFFTLGVLFDFIQMVMVYSFFAKKVSEQYGSLEGRSKWAWS